MTTTLAETATRDMFIGADGNLAFVTQADAVAQLCKSRVEAQRGEMKYATDQGMPTRQTAWDTYNPKQFEAGIRTIILATPDVTGIQSFSLTKVDNDLKYTVVIQTSFGTATVSNQ